MDADPLRQLSAWLDAACAVGQPMPEAMTLASATSDGVPSARWWCCAASGQGWSSSPTARATRVLSWRPIRGRLPCCTGLFRRTARYAWPGPVEPVSQDEADEYWSTRAPAVRLSAAASRQSRVAASRTVLETQVRDILPRHPGGADVPRPRRWGGFWVLPSRVEFWQESPDGLHDRIRYRRAGSGWIIERLSPKRSTASATRRSSPSSRPARHLLSQSRKRGAKRCAGKRSKSPNPYWAGHVSGRRPRDAERPDLGARAVRQARVKQPDAPLHRLGGGRSCGAASPACAVLAGTMICSSLQRVACRWVPTVVAAPRQGLVRGRILPSPPA